MPSVVGHADSGERILNGAHVFRLVDSQGLPLVFVRDELRKQHVGFDVMGFVRAASASGNYSRERCYALLTEDAELEPLGLACVAKTIEMVYG